MIDNAPEPVKKTYLKMKEEHGKKLELKVIGGNYYVYVARGIWDKKKKKSVKKTVLMGSIDENGTYREKRTKRVFSSTMIYEYGNSQLVWNLAQDMYTIMETHPYRDQIIAMAMVKAIDPMPLRMVASRYQKLYISRSLKPDLDPADLSRILGYVGNHFPDLYDMFRKLMEPGGFLFYDMTSIISYSKNLKLAEKGYNPDHAHGNQVTVIMAFSVKSWIPVAVDVFYGSIKDIKSLGYFIDRFHDENMGFIMDRGLFSESIIKDLRRMRMHYIVPLRRNFTLVPYNVKFDSAFMYNGRPIQSSRRSSGLGYIYIFQDPLMRAEEETSILRDVASSVKDMEYFHDKKNRLGVFAIISDLDRNPSEIYEQYKSREEVEQVFDTMKGDLESDKSYLRNNEKVKGFFFIVFLALRIRFRILKVLKEHDLLGKMSVNEIIFELSKMERIVEKNGTEYFAAVPKKVERIAELFKDMIPMG
ncbi:transposase [Cuniculiplasma sp. SKW3]|uniref:transposase n=1 Tax=Cuniculiplasma sp. SKW3 TaxID=3400170 RepID=UPI003FD53674